MTTVTQSPLVIPAGTLKAASYLLDLGQRSALSTEEWHTLRDWLLTTPFDNANFIAGEAGLALIRDRAPLELRQELVQSLELSGLLPRLKALLPEVLKGPRT